MFIKAAQYVRMSTDKQPLSIAVQRKALGSYAEEHGYEIVETYADEARSGLTLSRRLGMQQMLRDVMENPRRFDVVLVLDVSRWGRYQDVDEGAYYEFHCRRHGVRVLYVGEPFKSAETPLDAVVKQLKRAMAGEYSRELGTKVRAGLIHVVQSGFAASRVPCLGYRRMSITAEGFERKILESGQRKSAFTDRVRWTLGPPDEIKIVREIYSRFAMGASMTSIVRWLDGKNIRSHSGRIITDDAVAGLLSNPIVTGTYSWGAQCKSRTTPGAAPALIQNSNMVPRIVEEEVWDKVKARFAKNIRRQYPKGITHDQLLEKLRTALDQDPHIALERFGKGSLPSAHVYKSRFGSMCAAYRAAGRDVGFLNPDRSKNGSDTHYLRQQFILDLKQLALDSGLTVDRSDMVHGLRIAGADIAVRVVRKAWQNGKLRWRAATGKVSFVDDRWLLLLRLNEDDRTGKDFFLMPPEAHAKYHGSLGEVVSARLAGFRLESAQELVEGLRAAGARKSNATPEIWYESS